MELPAESQIQYICGGCGFTCDDSHTRAEAQRTSGKPPDELPATWVCPNCRAGAENFVTIAWACQAG
jgi:rubredoxin